MHRLGLAQILAAQRLLDRGGPVFEVAPPGSPLRGDDPQARQAGGPVGIGARSSSSSASPAARSSKAINATGKNSRSRSLCRAQGTFALVVLGVVAFCLYRLLVTALVLWVVYAVVGWHGYLAVAVIVGGFFVVSELVAQLGRLARRNSDG